MRALDDDLIRLGLALYDETRSNGVRMYSVYDLIYDEHTSSARRLIHRLTGSMVDFWKVAEELASGLSRAGIAEHSSRTIGAIDHREHYVQLTAFGRKLFDLAHAPKPSASEIEGLKMEDALLLLRDEDAATALAADLERLDEKIDQLGLSNFQKGNARACVRILVEVARMPEPDISIFWVALDRANQIAGVAGLIVALIALRMGR